ncbi:MAG TPA: hypothetical protein VHY08_07230 [Bacillota bacterium]|nr:hypothetical protein [Bacillota bacterium]
MMSKTKNPFKIPKFNPAHNTIVIELTGDSLIAAEIANRSNGTELVRFTVRSFPAEGLSATWLRAVWHHEHFSEQRVIYCISSDMVDYKSLNMPVLPMAELEEGVKIEIESTGRNNGQKLVKIIDFKNQGQMLLVNTALVNNDILNEKIQLLKEAGLEIIWSGLRFQGLRNFINFNRDFFEDVHSGTVYLDFCEHQTELGIIQDEVLLYRRRLNWGLVDIQNREDPEAKDDFKNDIRLTLAAYQAETKQSIPGKLIAFNMTEAIKPICDNIVGESGLRLYLPEKTKLTGVITGRHTLKLAPLIGLALDNAGILPPDALRFFTSKQEATRVNREKLKMIISTGIVVGLFLGGIFLSFQAGAIRGEQTGKWLLAKSGLLNNLRLMERQTSQNSKEIRQLRGWLTKQNQELEFLLLLKNNLPDGTLITDLTIENGMVKDLSGITPSVSLLLNKIKTVPGLERLKLKGTISSSLQGEIFQLEGPLSGKETLP